MSAAFAIGLCIGAAIILAYVAMEAISHQIWLRRRRRQAREIVERRR